MTESLRGSLPANYSGSTGLRPLRPNDHPISVRSLTGLVSRSFNPDRDLHTGHVYSNGVHLAVRGDGSWDFWGNLSDTSELYGDNFSIGFVFNPGGWGGITTGSLGAAATRTPQHKRFAIRGRSGELQRNFWQLGNVAFRLRISDDLSQVFDDLYEDLRHVCQQIELLISYNSDSEPPGNPGPTDDGPYPGPGPGPYE